MRTKKLLGIGLGSLLLLSLVGFGTAAAAQHQTEAEPPISLEKEVLCRTGENGLQFSLDGNSWMPQSEYEKEILDKYLKWSDIEKNVEVRKDFTTAFKNVKYGTDLSKILDFGFNKNDLKNEIRWFQEHDVRLMILDLPTSMIQVPKGFKKSCKSTQKKQM